uniref:Gamma-aminobutyric acid type A receptor subunit gamma3 n=1 Tax=Canis lupus dingo TaxID=286419 RepID=A0A8C0LMV2_CANLU
GKQEDLGPHFAIVHPTPATTLQVPVYLLKGWERTLLLFLSPLSCSQDEYEDSSSNQKWVLAPKSQDTDVTLILNKLLREYDKKLRPDIGIKPTVIDVDIYVNSIGPVSSINMVRSSFLF